MVANTLAVAVADFGKSAKSKLNNPALTGAPEDQLRAPLETLMRDLAALIGLPPGAVALVGETTLAHLNSRPDYAVTVHNALAGFIEVKAPGKGSDPRRFTDFHDKEQWRKLRLLPNILYTDGDSFTLWRDGELVGKPVALDGGVEKAGAKLAAPDHFLPLVADFLKWQPIPPKTPRELARITARLCRLLRDEVTEQLARENVGLRRLAFDWRALLFPKADDEQFADGYAQAVTFGLLIARANDIELKDGVELAAVKLRKSNSLIGAALSLLTEDPQSREELKTPLSTLVRVLDQVNWATIAKDDKNAWLYFYEVFLEVYDNKRRKETGSYYTPPEVVDAMTRLVDEALRGPLFNRNRGLASPDVTIADPAVGTGTFILGALRKIAENIAEDQGEGAVSNGLMATVKRIYGFELQFGPFAVAQLRILAELQALTGVAASTADVNLYITDTLGNPFVEDEQLPQIVEPVARSRREANKVKRGQPITVVIGNPPYKNKAAGLGGWIEQGSDGRAAPMDHWTPPAAWGVGAHAHHLKNLYIYFWRWASLKVFGSGWSAATGENGKDQEGIICFITVAGFLNGPGFEKMRDDLRRTCSDIWVIDCSPEGHQPEVATRIFQGVQQPVCIVLAARRMTKATQEPARVLYHALPEGRRELKFEHLTKITLQGEAWQECPREWRTPFLPQSKGLWADCARLRNIFPYSGLGVMPGRTWIIAPDSRTLELRWSRLTSERTADKRELLFHPHESGGPTSTKAVKEGLTGHEFRTCSIANDKDEVIKPARYAYRSFDRQWIIPDKRLINRPNPMLWKIMSGRQTFLTGVDAHPLKSGPAISFSCLTPDLDHYHGRGGRVYPLWGDAKASQPNIRREALALLSTTYGASVSPEDLFAYIACVMAHPAFTARFQKDLVRPGLRLPLTADAALFAEAAALGRRVVWLHCYGERFVDAKAGRPKGPPRLPKDRAPTIPRDGAIPGAPEPLPDEISHDPAANRLHVGKGYIENVTKDMWEYDVSGKQVLRQWFSYRRLDRSKPMIGDRRPPSPLEKIQPEGWLPEYTSDLLDLLNVLGGVIDLHPAQTDMLARICDGPLIDPAALREAGLMGGADETADD